MSRLEFLYLLPYLGSLMLSLGVLIYAWSHYRVRGVLAYAWYLSGLSLWLVGFILQLAYRDIGTKIFLEDIQLLASAIIILAFPVFAVKYTEYKLGHPRLIFLLSMIAPGIFLCLLATDSLHHWFYLNPRLVSASPFTNLEYTYPPILFAYAFYGYLVAAWGIGLLWRRFATAHNLYRVQVAAIIVGFLIPLLGTMLTLAGIHLASQQHLFPITSTVGNLIVAWGLFRFRIFRVTPVGRDQVFEAMVDPVVILGRQHVIIDINRAMLDLLGLKSEHVIGRSAKEIFADFSIPIKIYTDVSYARVEAKFQIEKKSVCYEMSVWPLYDQDRQITGRVYVCHDITAMKGLENDLRNLNQILEQRVNARTKELAEAYDTTLEGWAGALELRDKETEGHSRRVTETTLKVARALEIPEEELIHIRRGAILHDIGKMAIPDEILRKEGRLTEEERQIIQRHPEIAYQLLERIPFLRKTLEIPYCHHEKWDGSGYPRGLKERQIPIAARIFTVVDVWDAVQSDRSYNKGWTRQEAIDYLKSQSGKYFDPYIVDVFMRLVERGEI